MKKSLIALGVVFLSALMAQGVWGENGVLVVDDDCSCDAMYSFADVRPMFESALQEARFHPVANAVNRGEYEIYEVGCLNDDGPDFAKMSQYEMVIWFTGETCCTFPSYCLSLNDQADLGAYLTAGGKLFISAQDFLNTYGLSYNFVPGDFAYDWLKVDSTVTSNWKGTEHVAAGPPSTDPHAITAGMVFELENPFGLKAEDDLDMDWIQPVPSTKGPDLVTGEFNIDGEGFAALNWKVGDKVYAGPRVLFTTVSFAALKDGVSPNTKGELMYLIMAWMMGDYADYGDAPDPPYPSMWETYDSTYSLPNVGARHENSDGIFEWMGPDVDLEFNSIQTGDLYDDGVTFNWPYVPGQMGSVDIEVRVTDWSAGRYNLPPMFDDNLHLHGYIDWSQDGDWDDAGENVFCSVDHNPVDEGWGGNVMTYTLSFMVADYAEEGIMWTRFRLDYQDDYNWYQMPVSYGEVEDYVITLTGPLSVGLSSFYASAGDAQATLYWTTESEVDNLGFYLLRSTDGVSYVRVNQELISGHGTSEDRHDYSYADQGLVNGVTYSYKLVDVDLEGVRSAHGPISVTPQAAVQVPIKYALSQNYPNPFNAQTTISYAIPEDGQVSLKVFNVLGEEVRALVDAHQKANTYQVTWDGKNAAGRSVASGVYFCTLEAGSFTQTNKMVFLK